MYHILVYPVIGRQYVNHFKTLNDNENNICKELPVLKSKKSIYNQLIHKKTVLIVLIIF